MSWVTYQILATTLLSLNSILDKRLVRDHEPNPFIYLASFAVVGLPVVCIGVWFVSWEPAGASLLAGLLYTLIICGYYYALRLDDASRLIPILRLSGILKLILLALFLDDQLVWQLYLAFAIMLLGSLALAWRKKTTANRTISRGVLIMAAVAFLLAINSTLNSAVVLQHSPWAYLIWSKIGVIIGLGLFLLHPTLRQHLQHSLRHTTRTFKLTLTLEQTGRLIVGLLADFAIQAAGSAAITLILGGIRPFLVLILAILFLNESIERHELLPKLLGISGIVLGTVLLAIYSS